MASSSHSADSYDCEDDKKYLRLTKQRMTKTRGSNRCQSLMATSLPPELNNSRSRNASPHICRSPGRVSTGLNAASGVASANHSGLSGGASWRSQQQKRVRINQSSSGSAAAGANPSTNNITMWANSRGKRRVREKRRSAVLNQSMRRASSTDSALDEVNDQGTLKRTELDADNPETPAEVDLDDSHFEDDDGECILDDADSGDSEPEADLEDNQESGADSGGRASPYTAVLQKSIAAVSAAAAAGSSPAAGGILCQEHDPVQFLQKLLEAERQEKLDLKRRLDSRNKMISRLQEEVVDLRGKLDSHIKLE